MKAHTTSTTAGEIRLTGPLAALLGTSGLRVQLTTHEGEQLPESLKLPPREAAELLGTTEVVLATWRQRETGPRYELVRDRFIRYPIEGIAEWMATRPWTRARPYVSEQEGETA
jgi:hypothetical protein